MSVLNISSYDLRAVGMVSFNLTSILKLGPLNSTAGSINVGIPKS